MRTPFTVVFLSALAAIGVCAASAHAELTLWMKYYYEGVDALDAARYAQAETLLLAAKREAAITLPQENFRLAWTLDALGQAYTAQGRYDEAEKSLAAALAMKKNVLGPHQREIPKTIVNLGDLYLASGQYDKVAREYRHALLILATDQTSLYVCRSLNGLASLYGHEGKTVEAEALLRRAVGVHERADRRTHPHMAATLANLAKLCAEQGRDDEALCLYDKAVSIQEKALPADHPERIASRDARCALRERAARKTGA
ncbi:MAG TPA: tetratricopeptide repeat protein [Candidatus Hydrogenedentes bacterium]|nr:tetratricopeptide repeat protein [Candidatus Hydrogenedentota bacterium]HOS01659.1 tetratricopeptide repeat protein [Candidatus Hydrogenedentota bacterium]